MIQDNSNNLLNNKQIIRYNKTFLYLDPCNNKKLHKPSNIIVKNSDLNISESKISMKIKKIIDKMRQNREKNMNNLLLLKIQKSLDNFNTTPLPNIPIGDLESQLQHINTKYNSYYCPKLLLPPPPPPPSTTFPTPKIQHIKINTQIKSLEDLIQLCNKYPLKPNIKYNINMKSIHKIRSPLEEMIAMIGMKRLKRNILDQIMFYIQDLNTGNDYMHTVIYGPPGTGKTEVAKIIGKIYSNMGILKKNKFKKAVRSDLIAGYLGQTAIKTKEVIQDCLGGVLFIDEVYALGNKEKRDSFSKECIDTLCEALSDHKDQLMVIIAGYEEDMEKCFFDYNKGLKSRFAWKFKTEDYTPNELRDIFCKKVKENNWEFIENIKSQWFNKNMKHFKYFGRDMEKLFSKVKIAHSRRVFCLDKEVKTKLTLQDLEKGLKLYLENDRTEKTNNIDIFNSLYC